MTWPPPWRTFVRTHPAEAAKLKVLWQTPSLINTSVLARGFALVRDAKGAPVVAAGAVSPGQGLRLTFADGEVGVNVDGSRQGRLL